MLRFAAKTLAAALAAGPAFVGVVYADSVIGTGKWSSATGDMLNSLGVKMQARAVNNAEMNAYRWGGRITRDGFAASGDGGRIEYTHTSAACSISGGDGGWQVPSGTGGCWIADLPERVDARVWGVKMDGSADSSAAVQKAVTALCAKAQPGGTLVFPSGTVKAVGIVAACGINLVGAGRGSNGKNGTIWDYSAVTDFAVRYRPAGWPAVTQEQLIYGVTISDFNYYTTNASAGRAIDINGVNTGSILRVAFSGSGFNGIRLYGVYKFNIDDVSDNYYRNIGPGFAGKTLEITGDLSGRTRAGAACTLDCSTRTDIVTIRNFDSTGGSTGTGIDISGMAFTTMGEHISINNKQYGVKVSCPSGFPSLSYCPTFFTFTDLQAEGTVGPASVYLEDFSNFICVGCYTLGDGTNRPTNNVIARSQNYSPSGGAGGGLYWYGGQAVTAQGSCFFVDVPGSIITGVNINHCNLGNSGQAGVTYNSGDNHTLTANNIGRLLGVNSAVAMYAVVVGNNANTINIRNNQFFGSTTGGIFNASLQPNTIRYSGNMGPGGLPSMGSCGTSPSVNGTDRSFLVSVGSGNPSSCVINFGSAIQSGVGITPRCSIQPAAAGSAAIGYTANATSVTLSGPTNSGTYAVQCSGNE